jgi:hypothetical protein
MQGCAGQEAGEAAWAASIAQTKEAAARASLAAGNGIQKTAKLVRVGVSAVQRIKAADAAMA